jgi:predicted nucleic acid-binding protein
MYLRALDLYAAHPIDFDDALIVADMEQRRVEQVYSCDRDLDRATTVKRLEP